METLELLQLLVRAHGPSGEEDEIRSVCKQLLTPLVDEISVDPAGNVIGCKKGRGEADPLRVMVHMDELSMIIKRIEEGGQLKVLPLGGIYPGVFGQGVVDILGDNATFQGVLSNGPMHTSAETKQTHKLRSKIHGGQGEAIEWSDVWVSTRRSPDELATAGIHPGCRVVIGKERRTITPIGDCWATYFHDNRAAIATAFEAVKKLGDEKPKGDVYIVCSTSEEIGGHGANYAARTLPGDLTLAIDVGPVAKEYQTELNEQPMVVYKDKVALYDPAICRQLLKLGKGLGLEPQTATWESYGSDASIPKAYGQSATAALICLPTENSHGFEMIHRDAIDKASDLVAAYFQEF